MMSSWKCFTCIIVQAVYQTRIVHRGGSSSEPKGLGLGVDIEGGCEWGWTVKLKLNRNKREKMDSNRGG